MPGISLFCGIYRKEIYSASVLKMLNMNYYSFSQTNHTEESSYNGQLLTDYYITYITDYYITYTHTM